MGPTWERPTMGDDDDAASPDGRDGPPVPFVVILPVDQSIVASLTTKAVDGGDTRTHSPFEASASSRPEGLSRRGSGAGFAPLKPVKLSVIEAERRAKAEEERLRRLRLEEELRRLMEARRAEARRRVAAALQIQRVCRSYRRRLFLYAKKLAQGGAFRFADNGNPFIRMLTTRHLSRDVVPYDIHAAIVQAIGRRDPDLVPELRAERLRRHTEAAVAVQAWLQARLSAVWRVAALRFHAARRIQRRWRLARPRRPVPAAVAVPLEA